MPPVTELNILCCYDRLEQNARDLLVEFAPDDSDSSPDSPFAIEAPINHAGRNTNAKLIFTPGEEGLFKGSTTTRPRVSLVIGEDEIFQMTGNKPEEKNEEGQYVPLIREQRLLLALDATDQMLIYCESGGQQVLFTAANAA